MKLPLEKPVWSWVLYDWANSVFATTVMAGFFPVFFKEYWSAGQEVTFSTAYLGFANAISAAMIAVILPFLGALVDVRPWKKRAVLFFTLLSAVTTVFLASVGKGDYALAAILFCIASAGFNGACAIYDSLLPSVTNDENTDFVSLLGYSLGYLGGGVLFTLNVAMYLYPAMFGLADGLAGIRASFISVAVWWIVFSLPLFLFVKEAQPERETVTAGDAIRKSLATLKGTTKHIIAERNLLLFVLAYWLYIDGIYSVVKMAVDYGVSLGFDSRELIKALLVTQFVGFPAALAYSKLGSRFGARRAILFGLYGYVAIVLWASVMSSAWEFFALAAFIGLVQGGVQALSRSYFVGLIPKEKSGEYFGLLNLVGKFASIGGPALVATVAAITHSSRLSIASLVILFVIAVILLRMIDDRSEIASA